MLQYAMYTSDQLCKILNCSRTNIVFLRELGIIPAIKTGRGYMFSFLAIENFFRNYEGLDVSNRTEALKSKCIVESDCKCLEV